MMSDLKNHGQSLVEFVLVLPVAIFLVFILIETAFIGIRSIVAKHAASRAARVAAVYQGEFADDEINTQLPQLLFRGGQVLDTGQDEISIETFSKPMFQINALKSANHIKRSSPNIFALPAGLSLKVLRGGDSPSPYCQTSEGYESCEYEN